MALNHLPRRLKAGREQEFGLTLIEILVTLVVLAVLLVLGVPSFQNFFERNRLTGAAQAMYADLQFARAESIKRNQKIFVKFDDIPATSWCYGVEEASVAACDCSDDTNTFCTVDGQRRVTEVADYPGVTMSASVPETSSMAFITFDPKRGTLSPAGSLYFTGADGNQLRVRMSVMGRVSLCVPSGSSVLGYEACP